MSAWVDVCGLDDIVPDTGVCALVAGQQIAVVRVDARDAVYAVGNYDPAGEAYVMSRGIVGDRTGAPKLTSPLYKHSYDLTTGRCLDDPALALPVYPARVRAGRVEVLV